MAAIFAALAPTRKDLQRVEQNTAASSIELKEVRKHISSVDEQLREQRADEEHAATARRLSIAVRGDQDYGEPLRIALTLKEPDVTLTYIELLNESGALFGSSPCVQESPRIFIASLEQEVARRWFNGGSVEGNVDYKRLVIRAALLLEDRPAHREFVVYLNNVLQQMPNGSGMVNVLHLTGDC
jgi:hypothetical protein